MHLDDYIPVVGASVVEDLRLIANKLKGCRVVNVNSTPVGGGVAEILSRMIPLLKELGLEARWDVIRGGDRFFGITKKIHNGLHGTAVEISAEDEAVYWETQELNAKTLDLKADMIFIHDPQPAGLIRWKPAIGGRWMWRCHVDVSAPDRGVWGFLEPVVEQYDAAVFSAPSFSQQLGIRQGLIAPSIDPLSDKNKDLPQEFIDSTLDQFQISRDRPIVTQISRFDRLKDPAGVMEAYRLVKPYIDCQLVLAGGSASDDPEGAGVLAELRERAKGDGDIHILELPPTSHLEINALQRASTVILQKSIREGFGLTVSEGLWKAKPVIAGAVGGIPLQITHKYSGLLTHSVEGTAYWLKQVLQSPEFAKRLGENGREHVRDNFLLTRHLMDYLLLFLSLDRAKEDIVYL
ncbi:MAG: glycosyl transferase family 1 [Elusimicrobia bacterium RIFCSPLOWO2_01_FULL_59_12]|nr:MAG: glycosyl transferase family 1 [Elusimicrobia bacterium RIFCSPLOWO2_01_FULL_59_12]